jgi:hypothetical protein
MQQYTSIDYYPALDRSIRNINILPRSKGCRYLLCLYIAEDELVAKSWRRKFPRRKAGEVVVVFPEKYTRRPRLLVSAVALNTEELDG